MNLKLWLSNLTFYFSSKCLGKVNDALSGGPFWKYTSGKRAKTVLFFEDKNISANMKLKSGYYFYCVVKLTLHKL